MIRIRDIPLPFDHEPDALAKAAANKLGVSLEELGPIRLVRKSIDARKKHRILAVYCVDVETADEQQVLKRCAGDPHIAAAPQTSFRVPHFSTSDGRPPVIVGAGPCGLFAALLLAQAGAKPILIERGKEVKARLRDVRRFGETAFSILNRTSPLVKAALGRFQTAS